MDHDLSQRSYDVFTRAIEVAETERSGFIEAQCGKDARLRVAVDRLIRAIEDSATFLESPALSGGARTPTPPPAHRLAIGSYRIVRVIGAGGMATVYEAVQDQPHRRVALKVMRHGLSRASSLARFRFETEVLARLHHPGIAQIFEAGAHDEHDGTCTPFFAMELVADAHPITAHADTASLSTRQRLAMLAGVCDAVHHGHQLGIIHRDLKPGNILVGADGHTKVIDFGVARSTDPSHTRITYQADVGQLLGTLNYMSPEQCTGDAASLDTRTDVYSLGVILYELLCGRLPHDVSNVPITEALRIVQRDDPKRPSGIHPALRGDLEAIILKAIDKDRDRRYPTASEFAADIRRFLDSAPVVARPATALYQLRKFAQRNRVLVASAAMVVLTLIVGLAVSTRMAYIATQARSAAEQRQQEVEQIAAFQATQLSGIDVAAMGLRLRDDLRARAEDILAPEASGENPGTSAELKRVLASVNFTDVARSTLDTSIFDRTSLAIRDQFPDQPGIQSLLLQSLAKTASALGLVTRAAESQRQAMGIRRTELGDTDPATLDAIDAMGSMLAIQGKRAEAEAYFQEAYDGRARTLGPESPEALASLNNLCTLLQDLGRFEEAEPLLARVLASRRRVLGPEHPDTVRSQHSMANLLRGQGRLSEAEAEYLAVLEISRRVLPTGDAETLRILGNTASLLQLQGNMDDAGVYLRELVDLRRRTLGNDHPDTLFSIASMASLRKEQGNLEEAERMLREVLEGRRRVLGEDHASTLHTTAILGSTLQEQGKLEEAFPYYEAALAGRRRVLGDDHPQTLQSIYNMSGMLVLMHRYDEAEALARETIERGRRTLSEGHWYLGVFQAHLGDILIATNRLEEAEAPLLEAHRIFDAAFGETHARTVGAARALAEFYAAWDTAAPGEAHHEDASRWRARSADPAPSAD